MTRHPVSRHHVSRRDFLNQVAQSLESDAQRERFLREAVATSG